MILSEDVYKEIVEKFQDHKGSYRKLKCILMEQYNLPDSVISSLLSNEYRRRIRKNCYKMNSQADKLFQRYLASRHKKKNSSTIMKLAEEMKMSHALLGKMIMEKFFQKDSKNCNKLLKKYMKDTTLIEDQDLAYEIFLYLIISKKFVCTAELKAEKWSFFAEISSKLLKHRLDESSFSYCVLHDEHYGHLTETVSLLLGQEHEVLLQNIIKEKNLNFQCEDDLRLHGYDKTPDIKLNMPFAVDGFIVNWIESKALFASPSVHRGYVEEQYSSYWNRFGTGLVIYWKGLVDSVMDPKEKRFIVRCEFPENVTFMNPFCIASIPNELKYNGKILEKKSDILELIDKNKSCTS